MITIDQLLESVDLEFEPRFVTKDMNGYIEIWHTKPRIIADGCWGNVGWRSGVSILKLSEFDGKDWTECIYEVSRKTTRKIEKLKEVSIIRDCDFPSIESTVKVLNRIINRLNELVDAVNELKGK